ncbi:hypothetical protein FRC12_001636 [Ceratobasidium sp. 428]|nr:hypothetical protein FRC12_001636 [Ceratobasidium sp. 428]
MPELVLIILSYMSVSECAKLLSVNSIFFRAGAGFVWKELFDPAPLFAVLDKPLRQIDNDYRPLVISIPTRIARKRWQRFRIYADCMRKVTNFHPVFERRIEWSGLGHLRARAPVALCVDTIEFLWHNYDASEAWDFWKVIRLLLGPTTLTLRCYGSSVSRGLLVEHARHMLEYAQAVGSNLINLTQQTASSENNKEIEALVLQICACKQLTTLQLGSELVSGLVLNYLCSLPNLQQLTFSAPPQSNKPSVCQSLEVDNIMAGLPFPSLQSLFLSYISCAAIGQLFFARPSLLNNITELYVHISNHFGFCNISTESLTRLFVLVTEHGSQIEDLTVAWPSSVDPCEMSPAHLMCLFSLNLRRLTLHTVKLPNESLGVAHIAGRWPLLSHLIMPHQPVWPVDLLQLAERPALQVLCVDVKRISTGNVKLTTGFETDASATPVQLESQFDIEGASEDEVEEMARSVLPTTK